MNKYPIIILILIILSVGGLLLARQDSKSEFASISNNSIWWEVQSIDTVKYSRDVAREKAKDASFNDVVDKQVSLIAQTGVTHIAVGTPYDPEFLPFLKHWVSTARKYDLKVWFRGNFSGWEGWFGYKKISRDEHIKMIRDFITSNGEIFESGDIFSSCTECENGGPGDPRRTGDLKGYREFLKEEYIVTNDSFRKIGKNIRSYYPMNGDVAHLVMDKDTTKALGGIVVIDHYVVNGDKLATDIRRIALKSGGKVILGEFGVPIPDIHGKFSEADQAKWIRDSLTTLVGVTQLVGVNYWTGFGGSTELWNSDSSPRKAVAVIGEFYRPKVLMGKIVNRIGKPVEEAKITTALKTAYSDQDGNFSIAYLTEKEELQIESQVYMGKSLAVGAEGEIEIVLEKSHEDLFFRFRKYIFNIFH